MSNTVSVPNTNDSFTFNGPTKEIEVGLGTSEFNIQNVYSFWKQWVSGGNAQYLPAFRPVGGDDLGGGNKVAFYAFLSNGWRIRIPQGVDDLLVNSGILATDELDNPFRFDGALITLQQPVSVQFVENPAVAKLQAEIEQIKANQSNTIIPNQVSLASTMTQVNNTINSINDIVFDTNNRVISIGSTTLDIKRNTNLIPAIL